MGSLRPFILEGKHAGKLFPIYIYVSATRVALNEHLACWPVIGHVRSLHLKDIGRFHRQRLRKFVTQRKILFGLDVQPPSLVQHIDPPFPILEFLLDNGALKYHVLQDKAHLEESAGIPVQVLDLIAHGAYIARVLMEILDRQFLAPRQAGHKQE